MTLKFGTDGVRGEALTELTTDLVTALGTVAPGVLAADRFVIGRDTRESGPVLERALAAGLRAGGATVELAGVVPTPAVAHRAAGGEVGAAMISASHNPYADNGVKLFAPGGAKLSDDQEAALEAALGRVLASGPAVPAGPEEAPAHEPSPVDDWVQAVERSVAGRRLDGLRVVADCANGSAGGWAGDILTRLGADVETINTEPNGRNINDGCGSTYPAELQAAVVDRSADVGLAFDGDADRVLAVDHSGALVDGDQIIAICAIDRHRRGALPRDTVVVTVMANLGFRLAMEAAGIRVVETPVGDRYVLEALHDGGYALGGEQSGHVIFPDLATTGDGLLTGVQLLDVVARSGRTLADLAASAMTKLPQVLENVRVAERRPDIDQALAHEIAMAERQLGERGRVLIRPSGTEPLIRVMVEAESEQLAREIAGGLVEAVKALP